MEFIRENLLKIITFIIILIVVVIIFAFVFSGKKNTVTNSYSSMEQQMVDSTERYLNKNKKLLPKGNEVTKVNLDTLEDSEFISKLYALEDSNIKCSGYTNVSLKNEKYNYVPYLKCGKYHETKTIANYIKDKEPIVTSGDGLYNMNNVYVFRGENPKNYITIGDRLYRIIEIKDNELKLISNKRLDTYFVWDDRYNVEKNDSVGINTYSKSRLKESFEYIIKYNKVKDSDDDKIKYFSDQELEKMESHDICTGKRPSTLGDISDANECQQVEPNQKISLMNVSDYARASLDQNCNNIFSQSCVNYNYFADINDLFRTITATSDNTYQVFIIDEGVADLSRASNEFSTNIVIYIGSSSLYLSGDGTYDNPYTIR